MAPVPQPNVWLITGCSSGLGRETALVAARRGDQVIATARKVDSLDSIVSDNIKGLALDVTKPPSTLLKDAIGLFGRPPNVLVNNAGYGLVGPVEECVPTSKGPYARRTTLDEWRHVYETNVFGQIAVTQLLLPALREQGERSWILNISSYGGWRSSDLFSPYHTTKRALTGISRALSYELAHLGVHVVGIEPGTLRTGFFGSTDSRSAGYTLAKNSVEGDPYKALKDKKYAGFSSMGGKEPGDATKSAERLVDLVKGEGKAQGKPVPLELALGEDSIGFIRSTLEAKLKELEDWAEFSSDIAAG